MDGTAHGSHAFILYFLIHFLWKQSLAPPLALLFVVIFGVMPDFDSFYFTFKGKNPNSNEFQHHMYFFSHWPISYIPTILLFVIMLVVNYYPIYYIIPMLGIYTHLISDSACCGDGMMWSKIPWKPHQFAPFINLFSDKTDGYHGGYWNARWKQTKMFKIANFNGILIIAYLVWYMIVLQFSVSALLVMLYFLSSILAGLKPSDSKYLQEPENGRYDDYRKNSDYLKWMKDNGYVFNTKMHAVKEKKSLSSQ